LWIPAIGRYLSHTWIGNNQVFDKAAKCDDALLAIDMWNKHLLLLYPQATTASLETLRHWLLGIIHYNLLCDLQSYLATEFGDRWSHFLVRFRFIRRETGESKL
jgi:hypothetical protein